jgi:hypothetical protein
MPAICASPIAPTSSVTEKFRELCRLGDEEAFRLFSNCYYAIKLYGIEQNVF